MEKGTLNVFSELNEVNKCENSVTSRACEIKTNQTHLNDLKFENCVFFQYFFGGFNIFYEVYCRVPYVSLVLTYFFYF